MDPGGWNAGFLGMDGQQPFLVDGQNHEDWEEWLRWDPSAATAGGEVTSPEDGTVVSGSSNQNDSPLQNAALPANGTLFGKNDTLAPPMIVGEDEFGFDANVGTTGDDNSALLFHSSHNVPTSSTFDFQPASLTNQPAVGSVGKLDPNSAAWSLRSNTMLDDMDLSSIMGDTNYGSLPSAGTLSSNAPSLHHSPEASTLQATSVSSNSPDPPKKRAGRKRKAEVEEMESAAAEQNGDSNEDGDEDGDGDGDGPPMKKTSHNVIEKRYRNNLNDKIVELRMSVPSLRALGRANVGAESEDLEGLTPAHKLNKATIMAKATEYIRHLEKRNKTMADEMAMLKSRLAAVEAAIGKSSDSMSRSPPSGTTSPRHNSTSSQSGGPQGFLNASHASTRFPQHVMQQQQYSQSQGFPSYQRQPNPPAEAQNRPGYAKAGGRGGAMNKVMLGAMAGLMAMEGLTDQQQAGDSSTKGMAGVPIHHLFRRYMEGSVPSSPASLARYAVIPLLKIVMVIGALLYILAPLFKFTARGKRKPRALAVRLPSAPSLASPIEARRNAWLTAIQTVWVPKHFLLEVVAVTTKMISLSARRVISSEAYNNLTGANKEDESARVKAWDIAIDAQLAGGDQEVSYYRLLLTLMESGTLPDSPTRLMQKAVHFRVFFWEVANAGYGNILGFKQFTEKVGRFYWDSARRQQRELVHSRSQGRPSENTDDSVEVLPDHLASLLELDCDDVLGDEMIQRAWNLAWNKPSSYNTPSSSNAPRDAVVEDHAIRSPLDAVAAWFANMTIDDTLAESLGERASQIDSEYYVALAVSVAPPASATQARALAAKAILSNCNRESNVLAALEALPSTSSSTASSSLPSNTSSSALPPNSSSAIPAVSAAISSAVPTAGPVNPINHLPASPDVCLALTLAKLLSLTTPAASPTARANALKCLSALHIPPAAFTLLPAVAAYRLLRLLNHSSSHGNKHHGVSGKASSDYLLVASNKNGHFHMEARRGIEDLAANLRVWVGTSAGGRLSGLGAEECARVVELCLDVAKKAGGWDDAERDSGYGSADVSPVRGPALVE